MSICIRQVILPLVLNTQLRNQSSLVAFTLPPKWNQGCGLSIVATHVDSPNLRIRPVSKRTKAGYLQVGVETYVLSMLVRAPFTNVYHSYGGGLWHTWFDRDLSIAGRVITAQKGGGFSSRLIKVDRPILRIPSLAIHRKYIHSLLNHYIL